MLNFIKAELRKMKRPSVLYMNLGLLSLISTLFTSLVFLRHNSGTGHHQKIGTLSHGNDTLSKFDGGYFTFGLMSLFVGLIILTLFASQSSNEYSYGTLRNLLVRQPLRLKLLVGKFLAMTIFAVLIITFVAALNVGLSFAESPYSHINISLWVSHQAIRGFSAMYTNMIIATIGYGIYGMALGIMLKSPMSAISISLLWFMVLENILGGVLSSASKWLPGNALAAVANGGAATFSYHRGLLLSAGFILVIGALTTTLFLRRDVAN